jgi:hypothetical protein
MDFIESLLLVIGQICFAFGGRPGGKYEDADAATTIEFKSRKVFVKFTQGQPPISVSTKGGNVTVKFKDSDRLFTFNSKDNSFAGPNGLCLAHVSAKAQKAATTAPAPLNQSNT